MRNKYKFATYFIILIFINISCQKKQENALFLQEQAVRIFIEYGEDSLYKANELIDKALELAPDSSLFYITKARILVKQKNIDDAIVNVDKAIELQPLSAEYVTYKGVLFCLKNDTLNYNKYLNNAISLYNKRIEEGRFKENSIMNKWVINYLIDKDKIKNIDSLKMELIKDPYLNKEEIEFGIMIIEDITEEDISNIFL